MNFKSEINNYKEEILKRFKELLMIPSVLDESTKSEDAPFGKGIRDALDYVMNMAKVDGFETYQDGGYAGHVSYGNQEGKLIGVLCHLDVVPTGDGWKYPPFSATQEGSKIYGRGTGDDKGPSIAAYYALKMIKDAGIKLKNEVRLIFGTDEETGWRGLSHYFKTNKMPDLGFSPDADFPLIYGEKGRMKYDLSCEYDNSNDIVESIKGGERYNVVLEEVKAIIKKDLTKEFINYAKNNKLGYEVKELGNNRYELHLIGKSAHAMEPFKGINAGTYMCNFLKDYSSNPLIYYVSKYHHLSHCCEALGLDYNDYEMGPITCNIGIMNILDKDSLVTLDLRYPVRMDVEHFEKTYESIAKKSNIIIKDHGCGKPHYVDPNSDLVKCLYDAYVKNTGDNINKPFTIGGGTYASIMENAVAFGMLFPGEVELAHQRDEYVEIESIYKSILIYIDAILALGEVDA